MFRVEVITLVPTLWPPLLSAESGLVGRAFAEGLAKFHIRNLREYGKGKHQQVDDTPCGGGAGMVLMVEPLAQAISAARQNTPWPVIALTPRGKPFLQRDAQELAHGEGMVLVCGRYEGFDERVYHFVDREYSVGDFVLSSGDPAAWCCIEAVVRLLPGVLGNERSLDEESFSAGLLEYPHYTRPIDYQGLQVPEVLLSGNHAAIAAWRRAQSLELTAQRRADLLGVGRRFPFP